MLDVRLAKSNLEIQVSFSVWVQRRGTMGSEKPKDITPSKLSSKIGLVIDPVVG